MLGRVGRQPDQGGGFPAQTLGEKHEPGSARRRAPCGLAKARYPASLLRLIRDGTYECRESRATPRNSISRLRRPVPYLPRREERKVFTHLIGKRAVALNDTLTQSGFRRSQTIAYQSRLRGLSRLCLRPRQGRRVRASGKNLRRVRRAQRGHAAAPLQSGLSRLRSNMLSFAHYLDARHADGGMADMSVLDYSMMVEDSHVETRLVEYQRSARAPRCRRATLVAVCLTDVLADGLSMVYSFYDPDQQLALSRELHDPRSHRSAQGCSACRTSTSATGSRARRRWPIRHASSRRSVSGWMAGIASRAPEPGRHAHRLDNGTPGA